MDNAQRNQLISRFTIACALAFVVTGVCLSTTWKSASLYISYSQQSTVRRLKKFDEAIKVYSQKTGRLPQTLKQLTEVYGDALPMDDEGKAYDSWRHPLVYERHGNDYLLTSYGLDGKRGGVGLDCDLSNRNLQPPEAQLSFFQVILHPASGRILLMSIFSGVITFFLFFNIIKPTDLSQHAMLGLTAKLAVTLVATLFVATLITVIHIPSGH